MGEEKRPLGKILLQRKLVSPQELEAALRAQKRSVTPAPIASQLVDQGAIDEVDALRALSEQHGVPGIDLTQIAISLEHLDVAPREIAETHRILPVLVRDDRIFLAMADPHDKRVIDELEFVTGKKVFPYIAMHGTLSKAIAAAYEAKERGEHHYFGPRVPAETLRQLGLGPPAPEPQGPADPDKAVALPGPLPDAPPSRRAPPPLPASPPSRPEMVVDEAVATAARDSEVSTSDFGAFGQEVSSVTRLPDELRVRATKAADAITSGAGKLVLVVDDEEEIRKLLHRLLTQKGYRVVEADRGLLALRLVKDHTPDLIILDAMLPELHGFDIARRIKGSAKYGHIPIIMVSAVYRGPQIATDLKQNYGVEEYFEKPFRIAELMDTVRRLLAREDPRPADPPHDPEYLSAEAEKALAGGIAAYKSGQIDDAIEQLKRGVGIDPLSYRLHFHLALLYGKKGQIYEGIQELERAIELNPKHFPALKNLAVLYEKACFKAKAVEMWGRGAVLAPDDATRASIEERLRKLV
jgi:DNA-binding response OmpR family regulator